MHRNIGAMIVMALFITLSAAENVTENAKVRESFWQIYTNALREEKTAQFQVGVMYERGIAVDKNETRAASWYEKAALQGYVDAQYNLALMYASGRGVPKNLDHSMLWLSKAAKQGDREARKLLLEIIDGKHDDPGPQKAGESTGAVTEVSEGEIETIRPVTIVTKEGAEVCSSSGECRIYRSKTVFTSTAKRGNTYKISGIATKKGWKAYGLEGWIDEAHVDVRP
ncbi:sel1 repeat family protein [Sulfuricurvum sp. IAE1]|uniref:tetratricopeptide repeat protein n=1 Tax=Sulfuricurvum sp. IAE1 TaxID=2546102 RepID=UPI0010492506|nr:tetratricopeptide repeat protein [Sulfuricurvum sp. IAE1]TDA62698.1 sel1 repeat family protein [Sulfuricurvum sp. IAE1]